MLNQLSRILLRNQSFVRQHARGVTTKNNVSKQEAKRFQETNSFVANIFKRRMNVQQVFPYPVLEEKDDTFSKMIQSLRKFFEDINDASKNDELEHLENSLLADLAKTGAFGVQVPKEYGGLGFNNTQYAKMIEEVGRHDLSLAITLGAHQATGFKAILLFGNEEQKEKYLPDLASGKKIASYCLTESDSGSDAMSMKASAVLSSDEKHYVLNGNKKWITNGGIADVFTVFAKVPSGGDEKMSAFIVERSFKGVSSGNPEKKMGLKASNTTEVVFDDCKVPADNLISEVGDGFKIALSVLNSGRFAIGACLSGTMRFAIEQATNYAVNREQFGHKISSYGAIQQKLVRMCMAQYVTESMAYLVSGNMDDGSKDFKLEAAILKVFSTEAACFVVDEAIQILGGSGYMKTDELERICRDLRFFRIFEGTNEILRLSIAITGLEHTNELYKEFNNALSNLVTQTELIVTEIKRYKYAFGMNKYSFLKKHIHSKLNSYAYLLSKCIGELGKTSQNLIKRYGKNAGDQQFLLMRLADAAIDTYAMAATLSRATLSLQTKKPSSNFEEIITVLICKEASERVKLNLKALNSHPELINIQTAELIAGEIVRQVGPVQRNPLEK